jgi:2-methylcitrate dehydratase PrpD
MKTAGGRDMTDNLAQAGPTGKLARFVATIRFEDLPAAVVTDTKRVIYDTLASAIGGYTLDAGKITAAAAASMGGGRATVLGSGAKVSAAAASFANAYLGNVLDADDTFLNSGHPAACAVFPALALAETEGLSGKALIAATAAGFEVGARIGLSLVRSRVETDGSIARSRQAGLGWYVFCAAAASAHALGLDAGQAASAFGVSGFASPLGFALRWQQPRVGRNMMKYSPNGFMAFEGVVAAQLAKSGFTGDPAIFEGPFAYWEMAGAYSSDLDALVDNLGEKWWISETSLKAHAVGRFAHHSIGVFQALLAEHRLTVNEIEAVEVSTFEVAANEWFGGQREPLTPIDMQFSIPLSLASIALGHDLGPKSQTPERVNDPAIRAFARRVRVVVYPEATAEIQRQMRVDGRMRTIPNTVTIAARGRSYSGQSAYAEGDPWTEANRMTDASLRHKLDVFADGVLSPAKIERLSETLYDLENVADVASGLSDRLA